MRGYREGTNGAGWEVGGEQKGLEDEGCGDQISKRRLSKDLDSKLCCLINVLCRLRDTLLTSLFSCGKGIRISKIDQINIDTTCLNLLNNMEFVTTKID